MRVLIAPDCFGDSLTAVAAAQSIAAGWQAARPDDLLVVAPQSDGGPGFLAVLAAGDAGMEVHRVRVSGPLDDDVDAEWLFDPGTRTAYLECAQACGLALLGGPPTTETAVAAHSRGVGELIDTALRRGASTIVVGLGGSGCTDGGRGMVTALGGSGPASARLSGVRLIAATDVENPLLGASGAAAVFGPHGPTNWRPRLDGWCVPGPVRGQPADSAQHCWPWAVIGNPVPPSSPNRPA